MRRKKQKRDVPEHKRAILAHHQWRPGRADRSDFPAKVVAELVEESGNACQAGCGRAADQTHHVMPRGRGGRGVKTNGMRICWVCHERVQTDEAELQHWIDVWRQRYGDGFWMDDQDREEMAAKEAMLARRNAEVERRREGLRLIVREARRELRPEESAILRRLSADDLMTMLWLVRDAAGRDRRA